ncbi:threonine--tRNA ligase [Prevotella intermedia ATCC 25611 = DSM 20706]|uniref:Threonine--tRNA ligase n=1 Tax=Prevotella intermedia TaxID=28131 RepID=A0A1P8JL00_PREIN|nr:threonine--tRNA ligase [Prevotella intermedia]AFJ08043.1 threonine--tRNA ligase [Prevotella intermedia 17]APW32099.1 threonine--tRNA ligase [Prevotella intermedia ATCC 25611 = DSM 20706]APW34433.1 threonine--tRNA ligase [Prevotella intermedia]SUB95054.1 Threonine--tRNA ligase [Prevotella intermedia]BAR95886.1 threonyl-tRNA synthetase [Prevotella intermedia]
MVKITFPDGSVREYEQGVTGLQIAESISPALARNVVSCGVNGVTTELNRPINEDATIALYKFEDEEGKHTFWHSSAHLLAEALKELYPGIQFGFGPALENGFFYDVQTADGQVISENDFPKIEQKMLELAKKDSKIVRRDVAKADAVKEFTADGQEYKVEHIVEDLEDGTISTYSQGNFTDLCRGPHLMSTGAIKAVKLTSVAGAFWRGDAKSDQLTRIYGITFPKKKMLDEYLVMLEEAKKRDHRKIGKEMELFMFSERVGKGLPIWLPKGTQLRLRLQEVLRKLQRPYNYQEVITPGIGGKNLYVTSGHYAHYGKDAFQPIQTPEEGEEYMLKPMNCPHHCEIFAHKPRSYKDLPLRIAEFGTVFRYEKSGELHGLTRVRTFTQDDAHLFVRPEQVKKEFEDVIDIIQKVFVTFGFDNYEAQISLRDPANKEKYIGSDEIWEESERAIKEACEEKGLKAKVEIGEAAFYGPKLDFMVKDAIGRRWQLGTIQVDYNLPNRFKLEYTAEDNTKQTPVMIHRAPFGSLERFTAVLIEHTAGHFPLWLTPDQVAILPISEKYNEYAQEVQQFFDANGVRALLDDRNEKIGRKIRDNELKRIPYMVIVGEKEMADDLVSMRQQGGGEQAIMSKEDFVQRIQNEVAEQLKNLD